MLESKKEINSNIINGIAVILWGDAWAQHIENAREDGRKPCQNLSGCKIEEVMPEIPKVAYQRAKRLAKAFINANDGLSVADLLTKAYRLDSDFDMSCCDEMLTDEQLLEDIEDNVCLQAEFGESLAWMAMGAGVSWFDDHVEFPMNIPSVENYELQMWAVEHCKECSR